MSFRCELCSKPQPANTAPTMLVVERRRKSYPERRKGTKVIDVGGEGWEIAKEVQACTRCVKARSAKAAEAGRQ